MELIAEAAQAVRPGGHLRPVVRESSYALLSVASDGTITGVNQACTDLLGFGESEMVGATVCDLLVRPEDHQALRDEAHVPAGEPGAFAGRTRPFVVVTSEGGELPVELTVSHDHGPDGGFTCLLRDLDEVSLVQRSAVLTNTMSRLVQVGVCEWHTPTGEAHFSTVMRALHGLDPKEPAPSFDAYVNLVHPDDRPKLLELMIAARAEGRTTEAEWRIELPDGGTRRLAGSFAPLVWERGEAVRVVGSVRDVTEEWLEGLKVSLLTSVSEGLAAWDEPDGAVSGLIRRVCEATGWAGGALFVLHRTARVLRAFEVYSGGELDGSYAREAQKMRFRSGEGLPGRVWASRQPWSAWELAGVDPKAAERSWAPELGTALAFPVNGPGVTAVLEFVTGYAGPIDEGMRRALHGVSLQVGDFLSRHRADLGDSPLSKREREVIQMAARGGTTASIAAELVVSPSTVKTHFEKIYGKLGVSDRGEAVAEAFRLGLVK